MLVDPCPRCGRPVHWTGHGRRPRWCSQACRRAAYEERRAAASGAIAVRVVTRETHTEHVRTRLREPTAGECVQRVLASPRACREVLNGLTTMATTGQLDSGAHTATLTALGRLVQTLTALSPRAPLIDPIAAESFAPGVQAYRPRRPLPPGSVLVLAGEHYDTGRLPLAHPFKLSYGFAVPAYARRDLLHSASQPARRAPVPQARVGDHHQARSATRRACSPSRHWHAARRRIIPIWAVCSARSPRADTATRGGMCWARLAQRGPCRVSYGRF